MIKVNNIYINLDHVEYLEEKRKENTVFVHLVSGASFLFCLDDWNNALLRYLPPNKILTDFPDLYSKYKI